jgi:hypothetical protein
MSATEPLSEASLVHPPRQPGRWRFYGVVPEDVTAMARDALASVDGLGLKQIDLLGFSLSVARSTSLGHRNRVLAVPSVSM